MNEQEQLYSIALTLLPHISLGNIHELYQRLGSATAVMEQRRNIRDVLPEASPRLVESFTNADEALHKAEVELQWDKEKKIEVIPMNSPYYPQRLADCPDAPVVLFYKGNGDLNHKRVISIVGTRHSTIYSHDILQRFMQELRTYTDVLVVSGLAYGVDILAHRSALKNGLPTVGVLAHGLDCLYPNTHRATAKEMISNGGLLTEYISQTRIGKGNFVQRNRIVAGLADCTILVESAAKGGGLITMSIARDYHRDTFAFPGPVNAEYSRGCNNLIRDNAAALISNAEDFVKAMGWDDEKTLADAKQAGIERQLFPDLSDDERTIVEQLQQTNDLQINVLSVKCGMAVSQLYALLFQLEMKGVVKTMAGGSYHLL